MTPDPTLPTARFGSRAAVLLYTLEILVDSSEFEENEIPDYILDSLGPRYEASRHSRESRSGDPASDRRRTG